MSRSRSDSCPVTRAAPGIDHPYPVLNNMSARPTTEVVRRIRPLREPWVGFRWEGRQPLLDRSMLERLDTYWQGVGLQGAVIVHPLASAPETTTQVTMCTDGDLLLNVLLRTRGRLLLAAMPLLDDTAALGRMGVATDDPRLVARVDAGASSVAELRRALRVWEGASR